MEALAAFGLAANIAQFAELGYKTAKTILEAYRSTDGVTAENADFEDAASHLKTISAQLKNNRKVKSNPGIERLLKKSIDACDDLLKELDSLKFDGGSVYVGERLAKLMVAMWAIRRKRKVGALVLRVAEIQQRLLPGIQSLILEQGSEVVESLQVLNDGVKKSQEWHMTHAKILDEKLQGLEKQLAAPESWQQSQDAMKDFTRGFVDFIDQWRNHSTISTILRSLHFEQLRERQSEIPQAHKNTFQWMFDDQGGAEFRNWLGGASQGLFWITGKAGSGKSTLMKFLLERPQTKELLAQWTTPSGQQPLLLVSHFFWSQGGRLQRTQEGLLRTILFQILLAHPELVKTVCPERFSSYQALDSWTVNQLQDLFERLASIEKLPARIFIFVDGLDEYEGDPAEIIETVRKIASCTGIKVCCSSRPWREFEKAFASAAGRIQIHHLTENDIRQYVHDCFEMDDKYEKLRAQNPLEAADLVKAITSRAEGVFFWVFLVVKSLLRGLEHDNNIGTMRRRLDELPSDLNEFFEKMLQSIENVYKEEAALILRCLLLADSALPLALFVAMDSCEGLFASLKRHDFFGESPDQHGSQSSWIRLKRRQVARPDGGLYDKLRDAESYDIPGGLVPPWRTYRGEALSSASQKIQHRCRDLVQVFDPPEAVEAVEAWRPRVGFIHRTVVDFLSAQNVRMLLSTSHRPGYFEFVLARSYLQCAMDLCVFSSQIFYHCVRWVLWLAANDASERAIFTLFKLDHFIISLSKRAWDAIAGGYMTQETQGGMLSASKNLLPIAPVITILSTMVPRLGLTKLLHLTPHNLGGTKWADYTTWLNVFYQALQPAVRLTVLDDDESADPNIISLDALGYLIDRAKVALGPDNTLALFHTDLNIKRGLFGLGDYEVPLHVLVRKIWTSLSADWGEWGLDGAPGNTLWKCFLESLQSPGAPENAFEVCKLLLEWNTKACL
ncbi:hypothetical protein MAPG_06236 [Magnaporthiopsis poae ATCC 64411]|uniref:Nephrocystin 3-like N-terminal domain-containing protein n=1 Tax=Magnaporthiopsis poae (strain ATCC 64411 / 73-15) TaxID=644358 RepID=A0A0C4E1H5_MAGP6|nr:hypothetical protein MAPG_06236 [Magnaporthiopsis poae ATCC 64411]